MGDDVHLELLKTIRDDVRDTRTDVKDLTSSVNTLSGQVGKVEVIAENTAKELDEHKQDHDKSEKTKWTWKGKILVALITTLGAILVALIAAAFGG
jgi:hypothetical protein